MNESLSLLDRFPELRIKLLPLMEDYLIELRYILRKLRYIFRKLPYRAQVYTKVISYRAQVYTGRQLHRAQLLIYFRTTS